MIEFIGGMLVGAILTVFGLSLAGSAKRSAEVERQWDEVAERRRRRALESLSLSPRGGVRYSQPEDIA